MKSPLDRLPPHSEASEQAALGCIMLSPADAIGECLERFRGISEVFYDVRHQTIFETFIALHDDRIPIDSVTVYQRLKDSGHLVHAGGLDYVNSLPNFAPSSWNLPTYLETILDKYALRKLIQTCGQASAAAFDAVETTSLLDQFERDALSLRQFHMPAAQFVDFTAMRRKTMDEYEAALSQEGKKGLRTGFTELDRIIGGLRAQEFIVLAGSPSAGKTSLAFNIAINAAIKQGIMTGIISLETSGFKVVHRMNCIASGANGARLLNGIPQEQDMSNLSAAAKTLATVGKHVLIYDRGGVNAPQCVAMMRRLYAKGCRLFIVDYLQLLDAGQRTNNGNERMTLVSKSMKAAAKELDCPLIGISSLNRSAAKENRPPNRSDLRETGQLEFDADVIILLHTKEDNKDIRIIEANVDKNKDGETAKCDLAFMPYCMRFKDAQINSNDQPKI